jgi:geranylgeranyl pyrophosphate synthase
VTGVAAEVQALVAAAGPHTPALLARLEERLVEIAGFTPALAQAAVATIRAGGKRLRPLLVLIAADLDGDGPAADGALRAATAVELIHSATLVHDDVLDGAALRRGQPTVVATGGRRMATATGDLLFARAFAEITLNEDPEQVRVLSRASTALARGELMQREDAWDAGVTVARYLERCELKTGRLFEAACELGALQSNGPRAKLAAFGLRIGLAFQLLDDVLDVEQPAERTGKTRGADLLDGTVTLPLILARERDQELAATPLREIADPAAAARFCERIEATGALEPVRARAHALVDDAKTILSGLPSRQAAALERVADGVVERRA